MLFNSHPPSKHKIGIPRIPFHQQVNQSKAKLSRAVRALSTCFVLPPTQYVFIPTQEQTSQEQYNFYAGSEGV